MLVIPVVNGVWLPSFPSMTYTSAFVVITVAAQFSNLEVGEERERTPSREIPKEVVEPVVEDSKENDESKDAVEEVKEKPVEKQFVSVTPGYTPLPPAFDRLNRSRSSHSRSRSHISGSG